jgi:hypothetical protein
VLSLLRTGRSASHSVHRKRDVTLGSCLLHCQDDFQGSDKAPARVPTISWYPLISYPYKILLSVLAVSLDAAACVGVKFWPKTPSLSRPNLLLKLARPPSSTLQTAAFMHEYLHVSPLYLSSGCVHELLTIANRIFHFFLNRLHSLAVLKKDLFRNQR